MMNLKLRQVPKILTKLRLMGRIQLAQIMSLSESEFAGIITEIEKDPLFQKLSSPIDKNYKVISLSRFANTSSAANFFSLNEEISKDKSDYDVQSLVESNKGIVTTIKKIGVTDFEKYFLYNEDCVSSSEAAKACGITQDEAEKINLLVNELAVKSEFYFPSKINSSFGVNYHKLASIEKEPAGEFIIKFYSPKYCAGRYRIDKDKLVELKKHKFFTRDEAKKITQLIKKIDFVNSRKSAIYQIISQIIELQSKYFQTNKETDLAATTQIELAKRIKFDPSIVSRAIYAKSIVAPDGIERPIKFFLPNMKTIRKLRIKQILQSARGSFTDEQLKRKLAQDYSINVARRTVNATRNET
jgi:DNA-directed RNA polymerase specialized sigma54-like protein